MDQVGEDLVVNDIVGNGGVHGSGCNIPLKVDGHDVFGSPMLGPESSSHDCTCTGRREDEDLAEAPYTRFRSINVTRDAVQELTVRNYRSPSQPLVRSSSSIGGIRQRKLQHEYQLPTGYRCKVLHDDYSSKDHDKILSRAGDQLRKTRSDFWSLKPFLTEQIDDMREISACSRASNDKTVASGDPALKTSSTFNFSHLKEKKALKGKGVVHRDREVLTDLDSVVAIDENMGYALKAASDALVRSNAKSEQLSLQRTNKYGPEALQSGISLREWLKTRRHRRDKIESLQIFRQIVELVDAEHSQGVSFLDIRPSYFTVLPSNKIVFTESSAKKESKVAMSCVVVKKRPLGHDGGAYCSLVAKQQKLSEVKSLRSLSQFNSSYGLRNSAIDVVDPSINASQHYRHIDLHSHGNSGYQRLSMLAKQQSSSLEEQLEETWYRIPEQLIEGHSNFSSNIYSLGVLLFELLSWFESSEVHSAAMSDLHDRILPSSFLCENSREAGFCLWLLHPEPGSRPTTREILQSELIGSLDLHSGTNGSTSLVSDDAESGLLVHFLDLVKEDKQKRASKLVEDIHCLEEDIKEVERRHLLRRSRVSSQTNKKFADETEQGLHLGTSSDAFSTSVLSSSISKAIWMKNIKEIEEAYFSRRPQIQLTSAPHPNKGLLKERGAVHNDREESNTNCRSNDPLGVFFEGFCKFARYSKFKACGSLKNRDLVGSTNVVCSLSFDRDEDYIAAAGVSKKIKVFEFDSLLNDSMDVHYPLVEMSNKSKLSCVCWNKYIKNYLASTDFDGVVQIWDAGTGQGFLQYSEHQKRAWSVDFSLADPMMFASGSDDCSVKLWRINEKNSLGTIQSPANVCCVQFSASSTNMLVFGSADYKVYCYDIRHSRNPWCILSDHEKAVSYVKFLDSETLISASTDNTLKLWDLNKTSSTGLSSSACSLTFRGHTNEKNFVGLSALDGYIVCGSETNEVYSYYRSLPTPITSHKFGCVDPISGIEIGDDGGQFVSSVCWRRKSNMVVAANSTGNMKVLQME